MAIYQLDEHIPSIDSSVYVADSADIIGKVILEARVSIWSQVAIGSDNAVIHIKEGSNVQESSVLHVDESCPIQIGLYVTVGHQAMCTVAPYMKAH